MGLLDIFKKAPDRKITDVPLAPNAVGRANINRPVVAYSDVIAAEQAMSHPFIFFCLHTIASAFQTVKFFAEQDPDLPENERAGLRQVKDMNDLLKSPNNSFSASQLQYWMALNYAVHGRVPFKVGIGVNGQPNGIYPLAVRWTNIQTDARGLIKNYTYGPVDQRQVFPTRDRANDGESYVHEIFTPNIDGSMDMTCNIAPLRAIGLPASIMKLLMQRAVDTASGHPNMKYVISSEKTITGPQQEALREHLEDAGPGGAEGGNILFLYNVAVKIDELNNDLSDIHSKLPTDDMGRAILRCFGIPVALAGFGAADSAKYANNYDGSRASFWEDTIIPRYCGPIATGLTKALCPPGMRIVPDLDSIDALSYSRSLRAKEIETITFLTDDEKREMAGWAPLTPAQKAELKAQRDSAKPAAPVATPKSE